MRRVAGACAVAVLLAVVAPAPALITSTTPLSDFLDTSTVIVTATVSELDPKRPSMVLKVEEALKGKAPFETMPVLLKGDADAVKKKESPQLLKRVAVKLPVVIFAKKRKEEYLAWAYTNGTWFGLRGVMVDKEWRWTFLHLEPYLRKTYKGTTKEMTQTVRDALAGKKKPPAADDKEKPGLGPEVPDKTSSRDDEEAPRYAVVAPVIVLGPLVILATLFPTVFGGVLAAAFGGLKRWVVLLTTASVNSTLHSLYLWFGPDVADRWWGSPVMFWAVLCVVSVLGVVWAWKRHLDRVQAGEAPGRPGKVEVIVLAGLSVLGLGTLVTSRWLAQPLLSAEWLPAVVLCAALWIGFVYAIYARLRPSSMMPAVATEAVMLAGLVVVSLLLGTALQRASAGGFTTVQGEEVAGEEAVKVAWRFRLPKKGAIAASPLVAGERVYVAAAHHDPFTPHGALYCLDRATGDVVWSFSDDEEMKLAYSSPVLAGGKIYVGEGFHTDSNCKVYCLDAATGKKLWDFRTTSHTESTPEVVDGRLYVGAGDDGVYCLDAATGKRLWNFGGFHVDAPPRVAAGRVYAGCGIGDVHKQTAVLCLDAKTGDEKRPPRLIRRMNTDLPVWGRPVVSDGFVYVGCGNGRVNEAAERPAGEMLCLRESDGEEMWRKAFGDGILGSLAADRRNLYFGCRDGNLYALRRKDGALAWRVEMGSPVVSTPAVEGAVEAAPAGRLYAVAYEGKLACVDSRTGRLIWGQDLAALTKTPVEVISSPALEARRDKDGTEVWRLYVAVTMVSTGRVGELICLEDRTPE